MKWLLILVACAGCKQRSDAPPPPAPPGTEVPVMPASEVKRGQDACKAYVDKVCACAETTPVLKQPCALSHALPDALEVALDVAATAESTRRDVLQAHDSVRKIVKRCIEETAKLPA